ncbi:carboxy terminal-processing peptidase [Noviherbaspirillum sp. ST9]|uniref:carboxy terminal-processing peptidase n=1 Tax=Noviherbaspirillum sp. ST9 TaxID=3401606 RepID=UPI003B586BCD
MKWKLPSLVFALAAAVNAAALGNAGAAIREPLPQHVQAAQLAASILKRFPYRPIAFDAAASERIFERYIKALDPQKIIFIQPDLDAFREARRTLGEETEQGNLSVPFRIFSAYAKRASERLGYARTLLREEFDFAGDERFHIDRERAPFAATDDEVHDLWRKRVKNDWLELKLAGKDAQAIRAELDRKYARLARRIEDTNSNSVFQLYMDAVATAVDPHTDYFAPVEAANFDISMKLSLSGIGAVLQDTGDYVTVREIMPGSPAALSALKAGDRISAVGQGEDGPMVHVSGMRLEEVVELIRGPEKTAVRLDVTPAVDSPDKKPERLTLARGKISVEQQAAKKTVISTGEGAGLKRVGVISLPAFYQDFDARRKGDKDFRSATRDVHRLLVELKAEKVDGILIDLRNNGGGSLEEAVALTGLFVGSGPVVQERNAQGIVRVDTSVASQAVWDGPLGILINRASASASEIFAAAIQDYGRGTILGEQSFGKGTVQTIVDLDKIAQNEQPQLGELKMTIAQFFRINGGTTQLRGVTPDIAFPPMSDLERIGESSYDNALPWAQVKPVMHGDMHAPDSVVTELKRRHALRIAQDKDFQSLVAEMAEVRERGIKQGVTLNEAERLKERRRREARMQSAPPDASASGTGNDIWLLESIRIVGESAELLGAARKAPRTAAMAGGENPGS